jgi:hypothetical protein
MVSGFAWCSSGSPGGGGDCGLITVAHAESSWCHQLAFKYGETGSTGTTYDSKDLWTRMYNGSSGIWTSWYTILTSGNVQNFALPISGGTLTGTLIITPGGESGWREGIRINNASNGWTTLALGGSAASGCSGTWSFHTYGGVFYLTKNGSSSGTNMLTGTDSAWTFQSAVYSSSDRHLKKDIHTIDKRSLDDLFDVSDKLIKSFKWKQSCKDSYGFIAQELEKYIPESITSNEKGIKSVSYDIAYAKILASLINEIKKLKKERN